MICCNATTCHELNAEAVLWCQQLWTTMVNASAAMYSMYTMPCIPQAINVCHFSCFLVDVYISVPMETSMNTLQYYLLSGCFCLVSCQTVCMSETYSERWWTSEVLVNHREGSGASCYWHWSLVTLADSMCQCKRRAFWTRLVNKYSKQLTDSFLLLLNIILWWLALKCTIFMLF